MTELEFYEHKREELSATIGQGGMDIISGDVAAVLVVLDIRIQWLEMEKAKQDAAGEAEEQLDRDYYNGLL
jgi:hypothetical protein